MIAAGKLPWNDKSGRFSPLKAISLIGILAPAALLIWRAVSGTLASAPAGPLGPRPITEAIHFTGDWAIRFLFISLAITPLRRIVNFPKLISVRRQLGLAALFYAIAHLILYAFDQKLNISKVAAEIVLRYYLTIGFIALLGLCALGITSTDAMIRRMGKSWNRLHRLAYLIAILAALHFFMQTKADVYEPTLMAGFFIYLMLWRIAHTRGVNTSSIWVLCVLAVLSSLTTAAAEYGWYALATNIPPAKVLAANLTFGYSIRPAWWVLFVGLGVAVIAALRQWQQGGKVGSQRSRAVRAAA
ncbi:MULTISPECIES: sulfite oxidase heme-binding subunit YedZ [Mesorhizobium]|uniref:Protein-methionine-sulfoxide reductase heme-binding subunit MsrQ n=1 Tax=Mesorhizobium denitrificans TaxID=2294114 RepID=A0A371XDC2_9HYPH|nr:MULTISPECIES: protein-methionine-sulfoxide reductase heme-binding subunit MsrQ [Mesorhizobium]RFC67212.1 sulfoxide reductase heme-binding subunit YedZ [Mesorhizobium denitrificans]